ncbi:MAG: hypothetical protein M0R17_04750 [Candidatus Omnitrophica bacterium]|jgi:hypothetical protein|nr:hypothetical protein [Candidatus Omnitrophota bacterium]
MDNISGSANWTVCDTPVKKKVVEEIEVKEKIPYISPDLTALNNLIVELEDKYKLTPKKEVNDALLYLNLAGKLL